MTHEHKWGAPQLTIIEPENLGPYPAVKQFCEDCGAKRMWLLEERRSWPIGKASAA